MDHTDAVLAQWRRERPSLELGPMGLVGRFKRIAQIMQNEMNRVLGAHGLNLSSFDVLATLLRAGEPHRLSPGDLTSDTMVTSGTTTYRIDQLVKAGWVERVKNPDDGRSVLIALTPDGKALVEAALEDHIANLDRLTAALSTDDFEQLDRALTRYASSLEALGVEGT